MSSPNKNTTTTTESDQKPTINPGEDASPKTPTLDENKIPAPRSPPPAPRKRRRPAAMKCVRKLDYLEQTPIPTEQAVQEFFTSSFEQLNSRKLLKRSTSTSLAFDRINSNTHHHLSIPTQII